MPRSVRIEYPGAYYHVMARGNRREAIFRDEADHRLFLKILGEACGMTGWRVHAWVLMGNHYHLMLESPEANLVAGMGWLQNAYTRRFGTRHRLWGRLFGDRYMAVLAEGGSDYYYETLLDYIHLTPVRADLLRVRAGRSALDYPWCSVAGGDRGKRGGRGGNGLEPVRVVVDPGRGHDRRGALVEGHCIQERRTGKVRVAGGVAAGGDGLEAAGRVVVVSDAEGAGGEAEGEAAAAEFGGRCPGSQMPSRLRCS